MKRLVNLSLAAVVVVFLALALSARAEDKEKGKGSQLDPLKQLAGQWTGKGKHGDHEMDATVTYKVTSGGTAVMETLDPGGEHEMVTGDHQDGDDLGPTHHL